jgi:hypothetical protein
VVKSAIAKYLKKNRGKELNESVEMDESLGGPGGPSRQMSPNDMYASGLRTKALMKKHSKKKDNTAAVAKQVKQVAKKYTKGKVTVRSKGGKTRFIMLSADNIDNKLRKMILDVAYPKANIKDKSNIHYGNISDRIISVSVEHWAKALGLNESVETGLTKKTLKSYMTKAHKQSIRGQQQSGKTIQRIQGFGKAQRKLNRGPLSGPSARGRAR